MKALTIVKRYAQGFVGAVETEEEFERLFSELKELNRIFEAHRDLKNVLQSPILPGSKKKQIVIDILAVFSLEEKVRRFLLFLVEHQRIGLLGDIVALLPYAWKEKQGVAVFEVRSAVPLKAEETEELRQKLEALEGRPVHLDFIVDPEIVGGLSLRKGNIIYDASIKGQLSKIKEILSEG